MKDKLNSLISKHDSLPFLFVGSGFSRRYLDAPSWEQLLRHFTKEIDASNDYLYRQYEDKAKKELQASGGKYSDNDIFCRVADEIEYDFNNIWYNSDKYKDSRIKFKNLVDNEKISPFKIEIANLFEELVKKIPNQEEELKKFKEITKNSIAGVITTNYDSFIEQFFEFEKYIGQQKLIFSNPTGMAEIYKIHGCVTEPGSIVINSEDYQSFNDKSKYLAARLLTMFMEHPIIFIGYSITDENILAIIDSILVCLNDKQKMSLKDRFIFIDWLDSAAKEDIIIGEMTHTSSNGSSMLMTKVQLKDYGVLYDVLANIRSKYPVKILRKLKEDVFDIVRSTTPTNKFFVNMDDIDDLDNIEYVMGVGVVSEQKVAYLGYEAKDVFEDIVFNNKGFNADYMIEFTVPKLLKITTRSLPFYKYLSKITDNALAEYIKEDIVEDIEKFYSNQDRKSRKHNDYKSIMEIRKTNQFPKCLRAIVGLPPEYIDTLELRSYIESTIESQNDILTRKNLDSSLLKKLIKILDWLENWQKK